MTGPAARRLGKVVQRTPAGLSRAERPAGDLQAGRGGGRRWRAALTFENPATRPPETIRLEVAGGSAATAAGRALRLAVRQRPGRVFRSVVLLLERTGAAETAAAGPGGRQSNAGGVSRRQGEQA